MGHTPGPWTIDERHGYAWEVIGPPKAGFGYMQHKADAALIAAAPDMLTALESILVAEAKGLPFCEPYKMAFDAISKAKGE